jgi:hypothetical protein
LLGLDARYVVTSSRGNRVLFGAFEHSVVVRDLARGTESARLETTFDCGGRRLALSDELDGVLAAAYHVHGLAFYSCATGREIWRRKDIKKVQRVALSGDGCTAYCGREGASLAVVDLRSGETTRTVTGARAMRDSAFDAVRFVDGTRPQLVDGAGKRGFFVERTTFAFLDVTFAPGLLGLSESGGPVRCVDIRTGEERWRYQPQVGRHVLCLGYREAEPSLLGVEWPFEKGGAKRLLRWSLHDGSIIDSLDLGEPVDCSFAMAGEVIVTAEGDVLDCATGATRGRIGS